MIATSGELVTYLEARRAPAAAAEFLRDHESIDSSAGRRLHLQDEAARWRAHGHHHRIHRQTRTVTDHCRPSQSVDPWLCQRLGELGYDDAAELRDVNTDGMGFILDHGVFSERTRIVGASVINRCGTHHAGEWLREAVTTAPLADLRTAVQDPRGSEAGLLDLTGDGRGSRMLQAHRRLMGPQLYEAEHLTIEMLAEVRAATPALVSEAEIVRLAEVGFDGETLRRHGIHVCLRDNLGALRRKMA